MKLLKLNEDKSLKDYEKEWEEQKGYKTCDECGTRLNDQGTCPKCNDGEEDLDEAYDPQELNPDAPGPIYDMNVEFYKDLDKAIQSKDWVAAAKEWVELRRDMDQTIADNANKPFFKRIPKFFFTPHEHTLAAYRRRIPDEFIKEAECTFSECVNTKFTESFKKILNEDVSSGWAIFATDLATGKEYCAGVYDTENNAHYWAAMDEVSDKEYGYGQFRYRVEKVEEYTSDMAASANELNKLKIKNYDGFEDDGTIVEGNQLNTSGDTPVKESSEYLLVEKMSKAQLSDLFEGLSKFYGKIVIDSEHADKILKECGEEPTGKKATFDEILAVVQKFIAGAPMATTAVVALLEAIFDVLMWAVTAGLIVLPIDGPAGELITGFLAAIPVAAIAGAIMTIPAAAANRLIMLVRKALRKEDTEKVESEVKKKRPEVLENAEQLNEKVTGNIAEEVHNILLQFIEDDDMISAWNDGETVKKAVKDRLLNDGIIYGNDTEADSIIDAEMHKNSIRDMVYAVRADLGLDESMTNEDTLTEDKKEFYFVEIVPGPNGNKDYEKYVFSTLDEMKARVKEMGLKEEDIDSCGGCDISQLFESAHLNEDFKTKQFEIEGFNMEVVDEFEDDGHTGYNIVYSKNGTDVVEVEVWEDPSPVTVNSNLYSSNMMQHFYGSFDEFAMDLEYKCSRYLNESLDDTNIGLSGLQFKSKGLVDEDDIVPEFKSIDYDDDFDLEFYN